MSVSESLLLILFSARAFSMRRRHCLAAGLFCSVNFFSMG